MTQPFNRIAVIGSGFMGNQIALQCAAGGNSVCLHDAREVALENSVVCLSEFLDRMIDDGCAVADQRQSILDRIRRTSALAEAVTDADLVIEAVREDLAVKRDVFHQLDELCPRDTILATNSSSIRVSRIESATKRPGKLLNTHFVQPIWKHPFVELMRGSSTSDETILAVQSFMTSIGVIPVLVRKPSTGFIFNRIWRAVKKEALKVVDQGIATVEDVDRTWMIQMETPMGPLAMMDIIGLDVVRDIELVYHEESGDPADAPPQVLLDKIAAGHLGVKTGQGFYAYPDPVWLSSDFLRQASP
ncbi:MAG: 3-hydroxyacyl-CoA dehydrogenase family protein [Planctomycetota bacterium]|nr:3-hydroxyacyl-CoA dehydrogenase family protein [Planctomycetota bacterium]